MPNYFKITGIPGMDGLIVDAEASEETVNDEGDVYDLMSVNEIINPNIAVGDSNLRWPQQSYALFISRKYLDPIDFSTREYATDNPFGKLQYEGHWSKGDIQIDYGQYENALTVSVRDMSVKPARTVFTQNYYGDFQVDAEECIQQVLRNEQDLEELVFSLQDIAAAQKAVRADH